MNPVLVNRFEARAKPTRAGCHSLKQAGTPEPPGVHGNTVPASPIGPLRRPTPPRPAPLSFFFPLKCNYCQTGASHLSSQDNNRPNAPKNPVRSEAILLIYHAIDMKITISGNKIVITRLCLNMWGVEGWIWMQMQLHTWGRFEKPPVKELLWMFPPHCDKKWRNICEY